VELAGEVVEDSFMQSDVVPVASDFRQAAVEAMHHPSASQNPLPQALQSMQDTQPEGIPEEVFRASVSPGKVPFVEQTHQEPFAEAMPTVNPIDPAGVLVAGERFRKTPERDLSPFQRRGDEKGIPGRSLPAPEPQVRIGTIEVVVVVPAPTERSPRGEERSRPDLASRHYLRNF
jgi:hypothetical protein